MNYQLLFFYFAIGLVAITLLDALGSIASRKFQFKYSALIALSLCIYILLGCFISRQFEFKRTILINGLLGLYDGTVGFWISVKLRANNGMTDEQVEEMKGSLMAVIMVIVAIVLGGIGYGLAKA